MIDEATREPWSDRNLSYGWRRMYQHDVGRVFWRCESCGGEWSEERFRAVERLSIRPHPLRVGCPTCTSGKLDALDSPEFCGAHRCNACGTEWELSAEVIASGPPLELSRRERLQSTGDTVVAASGTKVGFRPCDACGAATEAVFARYSRFDDAPFLAWRCGECGGITAENAWRALVPTFIDDTTPGFLCPTCRGCDIVGDVTRACDSARCACCGARLRVTITRPPGSE